MNGHGVSIYMKRVTCSTLSDQLQVRRGKALVLHEWMDRIDYGFMRPRATLHLKEPKPDGGNQTEQTRMLRVASEKWHDVSSASNIEIWKVWPIRLPACDPKAENSK